MKDIHLPEEVEILGELSPEFEEILTPQALDFIASLQRAFGSRRNKLREHSAGLNCGRWDYIFSCIKKFRNNRDFCLADRALVTMTTHFMHSYSLLCIKTCHI